MNMSENCGLFNVSFIKSPSDDCLITLALTVGGTGVPLLIIIIILLCCLCCVCRQLRKKAGVLSITKVEECDQSITGNSHTTNQIQLDNVETTDEFSSRFYDTVTIVRDITAAAKDKDTSTCIESKPEAKVDLDTPQPYEEVKSSKPTNTPLPLYAVPDKQQKANAVTKVASPESALDKSLSVPQKTTDYSWLYEDKQETDEKRVSLSQLPEGMYSSIGEIPAPPLPPPLSVEDIPVEENEEQSPGEISIEIQPEKDKIGSIDVTDQGHSPFYTNVTLKQNESYQSNAQANNSRENLTAINEADPGHSPFYTNVTLKQNQNDVLTNNSQENLIAVNRTDPVEIVQDLYMNV